MSRTEPILVGIAAAALLGVCAGEAGAAESNGEPPLVTLSATTRFSHRDQQAGVAGFLYVRFQMADGWHIYWRNPGESGAATKITLSLPDGLVAQPVLWPAPERFVAPGDLLDYVYSGEATFIVPLLATGELPTAPIGVHADWFVCNDDQCLIGAGDTEAAITQPTRAVESDPEHGRIPTQSQQNAFAHAWRGPVLEIGVRGAAALTFFEDAPSSTMPRAVNPLRDGAASADRLVIEFAPETVAPGRVVTGVLSVKQDDGSTTHHEIRIPVPATDNPPGAGAASGGT